jgi:hypothetical protein
LSAQQDTISVRKSAQIQLVQYLKNGKIAEEGILDNNRKQGIWSIYNDYGAILKLQSFDKAILMGPSITFNGDGMVRAKENYFNNQLEGLQRYYTNGNHLYFETYYADGKKEGTEKKYFPNGKLQEVASYSNDLRSGTTTLYYDNGSKMIETNYKAGVLDGETIVYYNNGIISETGNYLNGKENGVWKYFYTDGLLKQKGFFKEGIKSGPWLDYPHVVPSNKKQK